VSPPYQAIAKYKRAIAIICPTAFKRHRKSLEVNNFYVKRRMQYKFLWLRAQQYTPHSKAMD